MLSRSRRSGRRRSEPVEDPEIRAAFERYWSNGKEDSTELREVFCTNYYDRIVATLRSRGIYDRELLKVMSQDIMLRILDKDHLEKYDPKRSRFSTHVYTVINSIYINRFRRRRTDPMSDASAILPGDGSPEIRSPPGTLFYGRLPSKDRGTEHSILTVEVVEALELNMRTGYLWSGPVQKRAVRKDASVENNLWQVFSWLYLEDPHFCTRDIKERDKDIADFLGVTTGSVTNWKRRIREQASQVFEELGIGDMFNV